MTNKLREIFGDIFMWKSELRKELPDKVTYDSALMLEKLKALSKYRDGLVGKVFTAKEDMELQQLIMDLVNEYDGKKHYRTF